MKADARFTEYWIAESTYIDGLTPNQVRAVRELCAKFFRKGCKIKTNKEHDKRANDPTP